jgi:hypothetical protein
MERTSEKANLHAASNAKPRPEKGESRGIRKGIKKKKKKVYGSKGEEG